MAQQVNAHLYRFFNLKTNIVEDISLGHKYRWHDVII